MTVMGTGGGSFCFSLRFYVYTHTERETHAHHVLSQPHRKYLKQRNIFAFLLFGHFRDKVLSKLSFLLGIGGIMHSKQAGVIISCQWDNTPKAEPAGN